MSNWKHTAIAMCAVLTVVSLSVIQMNKFAYVNADKNELSTELEVLKGDGEGVTPAFADYDYLMEQSEKLAAIEEENRLLDELINNSSNPNTTTNINVNEINVTPVVNPVPINPVPVGATESIVSTQIPLIEEQKIENPEIITFEDLEKEFNDII